jgi:hypothetical protein
VRDSWFPGDEIGYPVIGNLAKAGPRAPNFDLPLTHASGFATRLRRWIVIGKGISAMIGVKEMCIGLTRNDVVCMQIDGGFSANAS